MVLVWIFSYISFLFKWKFPIENSGLKKQTEKQPQLSVILPFGFWKHQKREPRKQKKLKALFAIFVLKICKGNKNMS